ncbi:MAG: dihydroneopterin aldolase [Alphaproteobacteria bacterium]
MPNTSSNTDKVFIKDLTIEMSAGIYDFEKQAKQRVIINVTMDVACNYGKPLESINEVISYEDVVNDIKEISSAKHYDLLEELAEQIAAECLKQEKIKTVHITIEKPDIIKDTASVGIEITRP